MLFVRKQEKSERTALEKEARSGEHQPAFAAAPRRRAAASWRQANPLYWETSTETAIARWLAWFSQWQSLV